MLPVEEHSVVLGEKGGGAEAKAVVPKEWEAINQEREDEVAATYAEPKSLAIAIYTSDTGA